MPRNKTIKFIRTLKSDLDIQAGLGNLIIGEPYFITDTSQFAIGTSTTTYQIIASSGGGSGFDDAEAQTYFTYIDDNSTSLSSTHKGRISNLVLDLKDIFGTNDLNTVFDCFWLMANETQFAAKLNLIKRAHDLSEINSPSWVQWQGYTGNGSSSYLNTNYNTSSDKVTFQKDWASMGIYIRTTLSQAVMTDIGNYDGARLVEIIGNYSGTNGFYGRLSDINSNNITGNHSGAGVRSIVRTASNYLQIFGHTTTEELFASFTGTNGTIPNLNLFIGARNASGTPTNYSTRQYSVAYVGGGMTKQQEDRVHYAIEKYMDAMGTGVLS